MRVMLYEAAQTLLTRSTRWSWKREPVSDIDIAVADSLKVLDLKRPIREATYSLRGNEMSRRANSRRELGSSELLRLNTQGGKRNRL